MLVLLVIFMVTAPLIQQQVDIDLPETQSKKSVAVKDRDVVLTINKKKKIMIAKTEVPIKELTPKLKEIFRNKKEKEIYLRADETVPYGFVVQVMALIKNAGIDRMGMITDLDTGKL
jgi:biopolymer transport protein TolR